MVYPKWLPEGLEPIVARLARVDDCFEGIADLCGQWSLDEPLTLKVLRRADRRSRVVVAAVRPIPPSISLLFSEAIHHLRAVLDNATWHLVSVDMGALSGTAARVVSMPIHEDEAKFDRWARGARSAVPPLATPGSPIYSKVRALQPFTDSSKIPSSTPEFAPFLGLAVESVHPLSLLQSYSNLDKHRGIRMAIGRTLPSPDGPQPMQDRTLREVDVGSRMSKDFVWGRARELEITTMVTMERPLPWTAAVSPAKEIERLRDWVRLNALPRLMDADLGTEALPASIELGDDGRTLRQRIADGDRKGAAERSSRLQAERLAEAWSRPVTVPEILDEDFET